MEYWIIINGKGLGPFSTDQLIGAGANPSTPVWREGLPAWVPAATVPELEHLFNPAVSEESLQDVEAAETETQEQTGKELPKEDIPENNPEEAQSEEAEEIPPRQPEEIHEAEPSAEQIQAQPVDEAQAEHFESESKKAQEPDELPPPIHKPQLQQPQQPRFTKAAQIHDSEEKPKKPGNYLAWSIISAVACCTPLSVVAIVYSVLTITRYNAGKYEAAEKASERAQIWIILSFVCGILFNVFSFIYNFFVAALNSPV